MDNFKNEVLNILGLSAEIKPPTKDQDKWLKNTKNQQNVIFNSNIKDGKQIQSIVKTMIDNRISNEVNKVNNDKDKKNIYNKLTNSLKSFTLDDILHYTKGFDIGKGFYKAKEEDIVKKDSGKGRGEELGIFTEQKWLKNEGSQGNIGVWYSVRVKHTIEGINKDCINHDKKNYLNTDTFEPTDLILALKDNEDKEGNQRIFGNKSPAAVFENGIQKILGGKRNAGSSDSVKDLESGIDISVKCYEKRNKINLGSVNALSNYNREVKVLIYRYNYMNENAVKKVFGKNSNYKQFIWCQLDKNTEFKYLKNGHSYKTLEQAEEGKKNSKNRIAINQKYNNYEKLINFLEKIKEQNNQKVRKIIDEYINGKLKEKQFNNASDFYTIYKDMFNDLKELSNNKKLIIKGLDNDNLTNTIKQKILPSKNRNIKINNEEVYFDY